MIKKHHIAHYSQSRNVQLILATNNEHVIGCVRSDLFDKRMTQFDRSPDKAGAFYTELINHAIANGVFNPPKYNIEHRANGVWREYESDFGVLTDAVYGLVYCEKKQQYLLQQRSDDGLWDFSFGGAHCWQDSQTLQTLEESLYKEAEEELGVRPAIVNVKDLPSITTLILRPHKTRYEIHHRRIIHVDDLDIDNLNPDHEVTALKWFTADEILDLAQAEHITPKMQYMLLDAVGLDVKDFEKNNNDFFDYFAVGKQSDFQSYGTVEDIIF